jgi:hypothetical protein
MAQPRPVLDDLQLTAASELEAGRSAEMEGGSERQRDIDRGLIRQRKPRRSRAEVEQAGHQGRRECPYRSFNSQVARTFPPTAVVWARSGDGRFRTTVTTTVVSPALPAAREPQRTPTFRL